jgi:hypothetical protein
VSISKDNKVEASRKEEKKKTRNCTFSDILVRERTRQQTTNDKDGAFEANSAHHATGN